ncbi:helix-turn-helix DNA-binding protein [Arthrobacter phage Kepler]|uniref:Helix-turn-helix DNA-binding protein n=1 Tax=Arthrobacter phage Kepler TaxID=2419959 RepID=A0A3G2KH23_9CAUD|nr:DNA binding protein [Arthrobacter phage Kepler]AYN58260.1 helix-turn-helix DNA-binding protein [Arthrobacter phage Kepler]
MKEGPGPKSGPFPATQQENQARPSIGRIEKMDKRPRTRSATLEDYARIHRPDLTAAEAAELLGVTPRTIVRHRARLGVSQPNPGGRARPTPERLEEIRARLDDGWSTKEITRTFGITWRTINRHFPGRGWTKAQAGEFARFVSVRQ